MTSLSIIMKQKTSGTKLREIKLETMGITVTGDRADPIVVVGNHHRPVGVGDTIAPTGGNPPTLRRAAVREIRTRCSGRSRLRWF
jgi:hypothetical protein